MELIHAIEDGIISKVKKLIKSKIDVNVRDVNGNPALILATLKNNEKIVEMLIEAGAIVNIKDNGGNSALILATVKNNEKIVEMLIEAGANVNIINNSGNFALMLASMKNNKEIVRMLIKANSYVNIRNNTGDTSLMFASAQGHKEIVSMLIKAKSNVNARNNFGDTALILAALKKYKEIVSMLLKAGASTTYKELKEKRIDDEMINFILKDKITLLKKIFKGNQVRKSTDIVLREISVLPRGASRTFMWYNPSEKRTQSVTLKMAHNGHLVLKNREHFEGKISNKKELRRARSLSLPRKKIISRPKSTPTTKEQKRILRLEQMPFTIDVKDKRVVFLS